MYDLAVEANNNGDHFPIWGSCLGFKFLVYLEVNHLVPCRAHNKSLPLDFTPSFKLFVLLLNVTNILYVPSSKLNRSDY